MKLSIPRTLLSFIIIAILLQTIALGSQIIIGESTSEMERYAGRELQRYLYQITGELAEVVEAPLNVTMPSYVVGTQASNSLLASFVSQGLITAGPTNPGPQGYVLKKISYNGQPVMAILGADTVGALYGVYGLLEDHYGVGFYFSGDVFSSNFAPGEMPVVDETKTPAMHIRGFLPWTNFPQSATVYSWEDWKFIIDQMTKMRMNFLMIHNYNAEGGHNEMFHNFTLNQITSRVYMSTAKTGHAWSGQSWDVNQYRFGGADIFDDYDFGASCTLHNESLSNLQVFEKGVTLFQRVIEYAHSRGVKVGLGIDINIIMPDYVGYLGTDVAVINARVNQIANDYPNLDYLLCFKSENLAMTKEAWQSCFLKFYNGMKTKSPNTTIAASGWGIDPSWVTALPADVIAAPIAPYSAKWENASAFGSREFWACPWLERDFLSSQYFYPYNVNLSDTIANYQTRTSNTKGLYCLTWRLTDAIDPKLSYIAKAPWDTGNIYNSSRSIYEEYALKNYGLNASEMVTEIIDQNEPFATHFGECEPTFAFDGRSSTSGNLYNLYWFKFYADNPESASKVYCSDYSSMLNVTKWSASEGGLCIGSLTQDSWFKFNSITFEPGMNKFQIRAGTQMAGGGRLEIRLDSLFGPIIGTCTIRDTGDWQNWINFETNISSVSGQHAVYFKIIRPDDRSLASQQIAVIDQAIAEAENQGHKARLEQLKCRIAAAKAYMELDLGGASTSNLVNFTNLMDELVKNFTYRVNDISSLGNILSIENRYVQLNYVNKLNTLRNTQAVKMPSNVRARGTADGAVISWKNEESSINGFHVYADGLRLTSSPLTADCDTYYDIYDGVRNYSIVALNASNIESIKSPAPICHAGNSDTQGPYIALVSPPTSVALGNAVDIKVRLLDNRNNDLLSATCYFRALGIGQWTGVDMTRRAKSVFAIRIADADIPADGLEYYIIASDGTNESTFPSDAPAITKTVVVYDQPVTLTASANVSFFNSAVRWQAAGGNVKAYNIYRSNSLDFEPSGASFLTYVGASTTSYRDGKFDYDGSLIQQQKYYRITAVDNNGNEGPASLAVTAPAPGVGPSVRSLWTCNETSGNICLDSISNFDGTLQNVARYENGKYDYCLSFNGSNSSVYIPDSSTFDAYTIGAWVKVSDLKVSNILLRSSAAGASSEYSHQLRINSAGKFEHYLYDGLTHTISSATTIQPNRWYYVVISAKSNVSMKLYVNGKLENNATLSGNLWSGGDRWYLGISSKNMGYYDGLLDEIILFDTQLSDEQIACLAFNGDLDGDRDVDFDDLLIFSQQWLLTGAGLKADFNADNKVDFIDYSILAKDWLKECDFD